MNSSAITEEFFYKISLYLFYLGLPNIWIEDLRLSRSFFNFFSYLTRYLNFCVYIFVISELGAYFTQNNLTEGQKSAMLRFCIAHPMLWSYNHLMYKNRDGTRGVIDEILRLKNVFSDREVEYNMVKKSTMYSKALLMNCITSMFLYTLDAVMNALQTGETVTTVITAWPQVDDNSALANIGRVVANILWWIFMSRVFAAYTLIICLNCSLSYQFTTVKTYFLNLSDIFETEGMSQEEMEELYEEKFKVGIKLHSESLTLANNIVNLYKVMCSSQMVYNVVIIIILLAEMMSSERTLVNAFAIAMTMFAVLISTGFFMWSAGDVTVEGLQLPEAMYFSGWYNCYGKRNISIRKLVVIAMMRAQRPVIIKGLGIMELSYQSYVNLVKTSYSVFSVLF